MKKDRKLAVRLEKGKRIESSCPDCEEVFVVEREEAIDVVFCDNCIAKNVAAGADLMGGVATASKVEWASIPDGAEVIHLD